MKKLLYIGIGVALTLVALGAVGLVYAQTQTPPSPSAPGQVRPGYGMMGGGMMNGQQTMPGMMAAWRRGFRQGMGRGYVQGMMGPMHDYMLQALAGKLNLTVEALQAKIVAGERPFAIAQAQGLSDAEIQSLFLQAHDEALKAAVTSGTLTQAQADLMDKRMEQMWQNGVGPGRGPCPAMSTSQ
jgi:hypothetical protein